MPAPALDEEPVLPPGFEDLLEFVPHWIGETAQERWDIRARATMAEITRFYDVLLSRSKAILDHVETFPLAAIPAHTRSEARRVGKECVSTCRSRWSPYTNKKKQKKSNND